MKILEGYNPSLLGIAWSPDGTRLATGTGDGTALIVDAMTGEEIGALRGHRGGIARVAWSPDGKFLATASDDDTGRIWDAKSGRELWDLRGHGGDVQDIAWSADGRRVATASGDRSIRIWDSASGKEVSRYKDRLGNIMAWDPAGRRLAALHSDGSSVEISKVPQENLPVWLTCALGQVPALSRIENRDDWLLASAPQFGSAAARLKEPYMDRYVAAQKACEEFLQ